MAQLPIPDKIPMGDWLARCEAFFEVHKTEFSRTTQAWVSEMFRLYNDKMLPRENGMYCSSCCGRVYKRLREQYEKMKDQK